jgi:anti-sigma regulatory factor (Ser/Thr protein kinase)
MAAVAEPRLAHHAFVYESPDEFVRSMAPFAREGIENEETVFAATTAANIDALREELGDLVEQMELQNTTEWQIRPYERLQAFIRMVAELPPGQSLRAMGEPVWKGSDAVKRQWARYESIINLALAEAPMQFICLYNGSELPSSILEYAVQTHPARVAGEASVPSEGFVLPESFLPGPSAAPLPNAIELPLEGGELRGLLANHGRRSGLPPQRVEDLVLAANEIVSNAIRYGRAPITAQVWVAGDELVCRVTDSGTGIVDPLAGWLPPKVGSQGGWGLPIARQLCDALEIGPAGNGLAVSLHFSL